MLKSKAGKGKKVFANKFYVLAAVGFILLALISLPFINELVKLSQENATAVKVNGEIVTVKEFKHFMVQNSASVYNYFKEKHGVDDNPGFWTSSYGGEVPVEIARQKTLEQVVRIKLEQILSRNKGLVKDISYNTFLDNLRDENRKRKEAVQNNRVIYGPQQYGVNEYFSYVHSNMLIKLKEKLGEEGHELYVPADKLKEFYEANKDKSYREMGAIKVQKISVIYLQNDKRQEAAGKAEEIKVRLAKGEKMEQISTSYTDNSSFKYTLEEKVYDKNSARVEGETSPKIFDTVTKMSIGEVSGPVEENNSFSILKCIQKGEGKYQPFEEIKDAVKSNYIDNVFEELVNKLVKEAKVEIVGGTYEKINAR